MHVHALVFFTVKVEVSTRSYPFIYTRRTTAVVSSSEGAMACVSLCVYACAVHIIITHTFMYIAGLN